MGLAGHRPGPLTWGQLALKGRPTMDDKLKKKSFCKWPKEDIEEHLDLIYELTAKRKFVCRNCARVARRKANLCKPLAFGDKQ